MITGQQGYGCQLTQLGLNDLNSLGSETFLAGSELSLKFPDLCESKLVLRFFMPPQNSFMKSLPVAALCAF